MSTRGSAEDDPTNSLQGDVLWCRLVLHSVPPQPNQLGMKPPLSLRQIVAPLLVFPIGRAWEKLPIWRFGTKRFGFRLWIFQPRGRPSSRPISSVQQAPREHAVIVIRVNWTTSMAYAMGSLLAITSPRFGGREHGAGFELYSVTRQFIGLGLVGLARRWIIYLAALSYTVCTSVKTTRSRTVGQ
ncbi:hypothetical protein CYLTODRAFT_459976 [Cylindrobasidium torrendii FP15055 ss-10]|uniref:Uncharacterized protein n=1 Tax=Cylindrobasidium torrendii FP15055 ss-10 TaxID=1314674 RepID=A0A0D7AV21_9AGAR|nr:hypothetical protein CYLTODRAFT_460099 [Cylindrobasidium torrendii FP15055 ss-10]KIY61296.1 hypothetical protein CYLTODRAFT_459976 [Cylindrobasidium torrendii FP15055 ss-10]